jgi:hypothetical protein
VCATIRAVDDVPIFPVVAKNFPVLRRWFSRSVPPCLQEFAGKSTNYRRDRGIVGEFFPLVSRSYGKTGGRWSRRNALRGSTAQAIA